MITPPSIADLLIEYDRALAHTDLLWRDLTPDEVRWRPHAQSSGIGWHLVGMAGVEMEQGRAERAARLLGAAAAAQHGKGHRFRLWVD